MASVNNCAANNLELDGIEEFYDMASNIQQLLQQESYKWIFVGGKGGVGKTTCSCAISCLLAELRESVLLISSDPAHNLSDAFNQKIGSNPTIIKGTKNLYAMEISTDMPLEDLEEEIGSVGGGASDKRNMLKKLFTDVADSFPGLDEAMAFAEIMKLVTSLNYSVVVFDTAPTGHTLRFLSIPQSFQKSFGKMGFLKGGLGGIIQQIFPSLSIPEDDIQSKLDDNLPIISKINDEFQDKTKTTFVCVCIAEFLSVFETERLIQSLAKNKMSVTNIIVNQLTIPDQDNNGKHVCAKCSARYSIQRKYLEQVHDLYEDYNIIEVPQLDYEVRGLPQLKQFSNLLLDGNRIFSNNSMQ